MKNTAILAALVIGMLSLSGAVVYENGSSPSNNVEDGEMAITSQPGSSSSATTGVGPNGTEYTAKVEMVERTGNISDERLENISWNQSSVSFTGYIQAPTPCHTLDHDVVEADGGYVLNMTLTNPMEACAEQMTMIKYSAEFESGEKLDLKVQHQGEKIREFYSATPGKGTEPEKNFLMRFLEWLGVV